MLNVDYNKLPYGYYTLKQGENKFKITLCKANAMRAEMYFYKDECGKKMVQLHSFLFDADHVKRCFKQGGVFDKCDNYVFYTEELKGKDGYANDIWKAIRILVENGKKVTIK